LSATSAAAQSYNRWLVTNHRFFWRINPKIRRFSKRRIWLQKANCTNNPPKVVKKKKKQEPIQSILLARDHFVIVFVGIRLTTTSAFMLMENRPTRQKPKTAFVTCHQNFASRRGMAASQNGRCKKV
jgi:hypothetical protein